ncbi:hypothetical protein PG991_000979 [Apiospora marii]|uniref:Uncharacterized protein n=1 Tax=Apiospora marii TaxID=335849 RepID=A0ABR1STJ1_9PEZI
MAHRLIQDAQRRARVAQDVDVMCTGHTGYWQCFKCGYQKPIKLTMWVEECSTKCSIVTSWMPIFDKCKPFPKGHCLKPGGCRKEE